ncbi:hypothetical protein SLEP1_g33112 [Rubroshorea leprosula]|uniref:RNase H type-1 domain-containing protein n=1 Tax=Rubroshorea leprosula TaxID=152421 RepID=A0AAV5KFL8_9ROSI|nr:hypothetical protein SLEP1_g33112 [Rubroshorea leprosula]
MIFGGIHSRGQSAQGRKVYARQVMIVNKNGPLKRLFEEAKWENIPITFSLVDYKRLEGESDVMMPHVDRFVATVHISNHNVNKIFIDTGSSLDILYWSCFQKMQLSPASLKKYERLIYGFGNQPVSVEGVITLPIYVEPTPSTVKLNPLKCMFVVESSKFLGYVISKKGIEVNLDKVQSMQQMEPPKTVKDVQCLIGHLVALHKFIVSEYDLKFEPRAAIKGQALTDFLVECHLVALEGITASHPVWALYIDGVASVEGSGAGARAVFIGPDGFKTEHALRFKFQATNNAAEYEALIYGLKVALELKAQNIRVFSDC